MTIEQKAGFVGLVTNGGRLVVPPGSLEVAENVVIRKPGVIEPRPGIVTIDIGWTPPASIVKKIWEYDGKPHAYATSGTYQVYSSTKRQLTNYAGSTVDPAPFREDLLPVVNARGNCYVGATVGVLKLGSSTHVSAGNDFLQAGYTVPADLTLALNATGSPTALATGNKVSYKLVFVRTDVNGVIVRSVPSAAVTISNATGGTRNVDISYQVANTGPFGINFPGTYSFYDSVEVYRTRAFPSASTIDEEYAFVGTIPAGYNYTTDALTDAQRGAALYTSPSQGGATSENQRPPACGCMALYKGHLFFGNTIGPFRTIVSANVVTTDLTGVAAGIGYRTLAGTCAIGSPIITLMANTTGIKAGQVVNTWNGATYDFPADTYVLSVDSAAQVTLSANSTAAGVKTLKFVDAVNVGGSWKPIWPVTGGVVSTTRTPFVSGISNVNGDAGFSTDIKSYFARSITQATQPYGYTIVIEEMERSAIGATASIRATHGTEYSPALAEYGGTATSMTRDAFKNGLAWSKRDEPEHAPPLNYAQVGDGGKNVLGLGVTRDSMFVIKEDGIWRLSGSGGNGLSAWRIDPFDLTTFCVLPQSIQEMNGKVYFLSNKGVVRVSDAGVEIVSRHINDQATANASLAQAIEAAFGVYYVNANAFSCAVNEQESEYMLSVSSDAFPEYGITTQGILVFNEVTSAWTTCSLRVTGAHYFDAISPSAMAWCKSEGAVVLGDSDVSGWIRKFAPFASAAPYGTGLAQRDDGYTAITISSVVAVSSISHTITYSPAAELEVGDVIVDGNEHVYVVTSVTSSLIVVVTSRSDTGSYVIPISGAAFAVSTLRATVRARQFTQPSVAQKLWVWAKASFAKLVGASTINLSVMSNASGESTASAAQKTVLARVPYALGASVAYRGTDIKTTVPRADARSRDLWAGVELYSSHGNWQLDAFSAGSSNNEPGKPPVIQSGQS